ncbi:MAG: hypothetical protein KJ795_03240 [Gammaproteobacteria bacterium]|nr:hypothetical protein [Gammaproteobacteria bacterium]MBU1967784.1 hypothetical protein [Gammaproteobacteria bacterium]
MKTVKLLLVMLFSIGVSACGGGGGDPPPTPTTTHTISGTASAGATLNLSGSAIANTTAAADGTYSFNNLANGSYTITPTLLGSTFTPTSQAVTVSGANVSVPAFTAVANPAPTYSISGAVSGLGAGVTVGLSSGGASTITDASGGFTFAGLANGSYTLTPMHPGYTFAPANALVVVSGADVSVPTFTAVANPAPTYTISGTASAGATLNLSGSAIANTTAAADGTYSFNNLANGSYTITPTLLRSTFTPTSQAVTVSGANVSVPAFTAVANPAPTYSISGAVSGEVLGGVTMTVTPGGATTTTDASGNYILSGLVDGSYTVTPSLTGQTFTPASISTLVSGANVTGMDFVEVVPMATSGKFLFPCYDPSRPFSNDDGWVCSFDLASGLLIRHWGGEQILFGWHYPSVYPDKIIPSRVGGNIVFNGFNVPCLMIASMTTMSPTCAIPPASNVAFRGNPDLSVNGDIVLFAQGFDSLTVPYQQHIEMFLTDGTGLNAIEVTNSATDIDSSPVFATPTNQNSVSTDILFLRNGVDMMKLTVNITGVAPVSPATVFESNVVGGFRSLSVNATFTEVAFMKVADGEIFIFKKAIDGSTAAVQLRKGTDPFWTTDGTDRILFTSNGARWSMSPDGKDLKQIPYPSTLSTAVSSSACGGLCLGSIVSFPAGF